MVSLTFAYEATGLHFLIPDKEILAGIEIEGETITLNLNQLLAAREIPIIITRMEAVDQSYQVDFKVDYHALRPR